MRFRLLGWGSGVAVVSWNAARCSVAIGSRTICVLFFLGLIRDGVGTVVENLTSVLISPAPGLAGGLPLQGTGRLLVAGGVLLGIGWL